LTTHGTSYLGLIMRLGGVYETRGDSEINLKVAEKKTAQAKAKKAAQASRIDRWGRVSKEVA
ncbi:hypothetical protein QVM48_25055, partial [Pseudomonas soli]